MGISVEFQGRAKLSKLVGFLLFQKDPRKSHAEIFERWMRKTPANKGQIRHSVTPDAFAQCELSRIRYLINYNAQWGGFPRVSAIDSVKGRNFGFDSSEIRVRGSLFNVCFARGIAQSGEITRPFLPDIVGHCGTDECVD